MMRSAVVGTFCLALAAAAVAGAAPRIAGRPTPSDPALVALQSRVARLEEENATLRRFLMIQGDSLTIEAGRDLTLKAGRHLKVESGAETKLHAGSKLQVEASTTLELRGQSLVEVRGGLIKLN